MMNRFIEALMRAIRLRSVLVRYHRIRLDSAVRAMSRFGTERSMPVGCSRRLQQHQGALRRLGFLVDREFALRRRAISGPEAYQGFCRQLRARFPDGTWACAASGKRVVVTAPAYQLGEWEQFLIGYDDEGDAGV